MQKRSKQRVPAETIRDLLWCDMSTGALFWRKGGPGRRVGKKIYVWPGRHGYLYFTLTNKLHGRRHYLVHHLVWAILHAKWPSLTIDHINRNKADNRPANLREVPLARNIVNKGVLKHSRSQRKGVKLDLRNGRYYAYLATRSRTIYLGGYATADEAYAVRLEAEKRFYGESLSEPAIRSEPVHDVSNPPERVEVG